ANTAPERRHCPVDPVPRTRDRPLLAWRDEPHDPAAVDGRVRLRVAPWLQFRQRPDGHWLAPRGNSPGAAAVQRGSGDRPAWLRLPGPAAGKIIPATGNPLADLGSAYARLCGWFSRRVLDDSARGHDDGAKPMTLLAHIQSGEA